jgi:glycosyltransferase involved in cell wall biosynthesis
VDRGDREPASRVAVVIPCFNDGAVVGDAIASAQAEGVEDIVVVDDGSDAPSTIAALATLEESGVRVVRKENGGLASARTFGLRVVDSEYVFVLDADDEIALGAIEALVRKLDEDSSLAVAWGDVERFGQAGGLRYRKGDVLDPWRITFVNELVASTLVRREAVLEVGGWTLDDAFEDWDLWMRLAESGYGGARIDRVTLRYRVDDPRMYRKALLRYDQLDAKLRQRHPALFRQRKLHRAASGAPRRLKATWTAIDSLPLAARHRRVLLFGALVALQPSRRRRRFA